VEVSGKGASRPAFTTAFEDFSATTPPRSRTTFEPPPGADYRFDDVLDIADAANQYAPYLAPERVAGLTKEVQAERAVGLYGSGVTRLLTVPMRHQEADPLREQLLRTLGVQSIPEGTLVTVGPLSVLLTGSDGSGAFLLAGTVTPETLTQGAADLYFPIKVMR
jgi:hypothetical protein